MKIATILALVAKVRFIVSRVRFYAQGILEGEPIRAIVYVGAVAYWGLALALDRIPDVTLDSALVQATALAIAATEFARKYVYSKPTVVRIEAGLESS